VADNRVEIGVQQRLAAAQRDDAGAQRRKSIDPAKHVVRGDRGGMIVELVAVPAREIAAAGRNEVRENRPVWKSQRQDEHPGLAEPPACPSKGLRESCRQHGKPPFGRGATEHPMFSQTL
jgi:hypothetical protein